MTQTVTIKDPSAPATTAQISYLESLVSQRECPTAAERYRFAKEAGFLAKGAASKLIDQLLAAPKKTAKPVIQDWTTAKAVVVAAAEVPAAPALTELPAFGYYDVDGTIYHWGVTTKDTYPTLRRLYVITNYDGSKKGSWKKAYIKWDPAMQVEATWTPYAGQSYKKDPVTKKVTVPAQLVGKTPMTLDEAKAKGKAFTFCVKCGATLTDPVSVANGIGPVCIKAFV